jgi:hypothetical protein
MIEVDRNEFIQCLRNLGDGILMLPGEIVVKRICAQLLLDWRILDELDLAMINRARKSVLGANFCRNVFGTRDCDCDVIKPRLGLRVAKYFCGFGLFFGQVSKSIPQTDSWRVEFVDGDCEDYHSIEIRVCECK